MKATGFVVLEKGKLFRFREPRTPQETARIILKYRMREDNLPFNPKGRTAWAEGYLEAINDMRHWDGLDRVEMIEAIDQMSSDLFYCNAPHIIGANNTEVPSSFRKECASYINDLLFNEIMQENG